MTNTKSVLSVGMAAATLVLVSFPFIESLKLALPGVGPFLAMVGIVPGTEPAWIAPISGASTVGLATAAFIVSWKQRSYLVTGLLTSSRIFYITGTLIAVSYLFGMLIPGPILGTISGFAILGLGITKGVRTARTVPLISR